MKLCVDNLPCSITSARLRKLCSQFGTVESATVHFDPNTGRSRGYGLVDFNEAIPIIINLMRDHISNAKGNNYI